ncbi:cyclin-dependent kinase 11B isoform X2 [Triplophysa dalaica]|uniref:cyclin-dependent kinase 11B isoform X2 n=1 Tax=Triplophysa dalaica TaxID=1582913 RepID=UPI0024DF92BE|nr:cyclin-dependent kinase 11B isoform X2 [Triplophysa dalaica]
MFLCYLRLVLGSSRTSSYLYFRRKTCYDGWRGEIEVINDELYFDGGDLELMGDEKETWKVKTLDEILQEKKRRRELEEKSDPKRQNNTDDRESKRDTPEEGELRDQRMEITIHNSPYAREDSTEDRGEEDESLAIKPPQQMARKDKSYHRKEEKRKDKRRRRSHSAEGGKHVRVKDKEKEKRDSERRKRQWQDDNKVRRDYDRQKRRDQARDHSRRERDRLEQLERQRERERKLREQQHKEQREQRELKERERRAEERRKERDTRREGPVSHHRGLPIEEYGDKSRSRHRSRSRSPVRLQREPKAESSEQRRAVREGKTEDKDLLADLQDVSDSERKTSTPESSLGSGSEDDDGEENENENEEEESSSPSDGDEDGESVSDTEGSEQSGVELSDEDQSEEDEDRENGTHIPPIPGSRFDHDSEASIEEEEAEEGEEALDVTPQSPSHSATPEDNYIPESPPISPVELKKELPKYLPALQGCRSVEEFQCLNRIEEGTYGVVYRAKDKKTDEIVALKRLKMEKEKEGFPITSLREINTILKAQHPNIVTVREIVVGSNMDKIYIVMNYVEHDLKSLMETMKQPFLPGEVKTLMIQLLRGVRHLHDNWILHRDLKTSNLLLSHKGILKIGDFGLAREYGSPLKPYTPVVVTLWYRSPDLLLGAKEYSTAVDMWSVGCIFGELLTQKPLFPGKSEIDQINKLFKDLGSPSEKIWPGYSELPAVKKMTFTEYPYNNLRKRFGALLSDQGFDLMNKFLTYCPAKRITADEALKHEYFRESPLPIEPSMFPTWPAKSEQQRVKRGTSPRPPEGGLGFSQLGDDDLKETGFHLTTANQGASKAGPGFSLKF